MSNVKIHIRRDFRCFKKDDTYNLDLQPGQITYLVGKNGCGKSTLMFALRHRMDSLKEVNMKKSDGLRNMATMVHYLDVGSNMEIEGFDFDKAFFKDTVVDNPTSFINAASAYGLIAGGGLVAGRKSNGQASVDQLVRFLGDVVKMCGEKSDERILIGLDELDDGMDLRAQMKQSFILSHMVFDRYPNASILIISHSLFTVMGAEVTDGIKYRILDVSRNEYTSAGEYFKDETGYICELSKFNKINE